MSECEYFPYRHAFLGLETAEAASKEGFFFFFIGRRKHPQRACSQSRLSVVQAPGAFFPGCHGLVVASSWPPTESAFLLYSKEERCARIIVAIWPFRGRISRIWSSNQGENSKYTVKLIKVIFGLLKNFKNL